MISLSLTYPPDSTLARFPFINFHNGKTRGEETAGFGSLKIIAGTDMSLILEMLAVNTVC